MKFMNFKGGGAQSSRRLRTSGVLCWQVGPQWRRQTSIPSACEEKLSTLEAVTSCLVAS
jgi:hypothetical protein